MMTALDTLDAHKQSLLRFAAYARDRATMSEILVNHIKDRLQTLQTAGTLWGKSKVYTDPQIVKNMEACHLLVGGGRF